MTPSRTSSVFDQPESLSGEVHQPELRVDKERVEVLVRINGGPRLEGHLFLFQEGMADRPLWMRVLAFLNEGERFFPLQTLANRTVLVSREQVLDVSLVHAAADSLGDDPDLSVTTVQTRAMLIDGSTVEGAVVIESDAQHERLSDFVARTEPFLYMSAACDTLVNKHCIRILQPLN